MQTHSLRGPGKERQQLSLRYTFPFANTVMGKYSLPVKQAHFKQPGIFTQWSPIITLQAPRLPCELLSQGLIELMSHGHSSHYSRRHFSVGRGWDLQRVRCTLPCPDLYTMLCRGERSAWVSFDTEVFDLVQSRDQTLPPDCIILLKKSGNIGLCS